MSEILKTHEYNNLIKEIKDRIYKSQYEALKAVNKTLIELYLDIGKEIVKKQEELGWGKSIVEALSKALQEEFPGIKGFSAANLWRMRNFYFTYQGNAKLAPLVREVSWTKNIITQRSCNGQLIMDN
jgi:predicted nuclease of restriction endonuclease-like (RecB) superfamily